MVRAGVARKACGVEPFAAAGGDGLRVDRAERWWVGDVLAGWEYVGADSGFGLKVAGEGRAGRAACGSALLA